MHESLFAFLKKEDSTFYGSELLLQKLASVFVLMMKCDYPEYWPESI